MNTEERKPHVNTRDEIKNPVQQIRPDDSEETIQKPATKEEMKEAIMEINPDVNTRERG